MTHYSPITPLGDQTDSQAYGFLLGARIRTEHGERAIETLQPGDRVITRHGKLATLTAVEADGRTERNANVVLISKGAFGGGHPRRDLYVAPDQLISLSGEELNHYFDATTVQVAARDLMWMEGVTFISATPPVTFVTLTFEAPQVVFVQGLACGTVPASNPDLTEMVLSKDQSRLLAQSASLPQAA